MLSAPNRLGHSGQSDNESTSIVVQRCRRIIRALLLHSVVVLQCFIIYNAFSLSSSADLALALQKDLRKRSLLKSYV